LEHQSGREFIAGCGALFPSAGNYESLPVARFLKQDILENGSERIERSVRPERHRTFRIHHQTVEAFTVEDREFKHGKLAEAAFDYVAQADDGPLSR
jgi:hypothetical protein